MSNPLETLLLKIRKAETPFFRGLKRFLKGVAHFSMPVPALLRPVFRGMYTGHFLVVEFVRRMVSSFYRAPLLRARCAHVGKNLQLENLPEISGNVKITLGDNVILGGVLGILGGYTYDEPELIIGDRCFIGHQCRFFVAQKIVMEEGAAMAPECWIADTDGHPKDYEARLRKDVVPAAEIAPVRIGKNAWLGNRCIVMKGVTIGEGAVLAPGSVVLSDIPPFAIAMGNPARVVRKNPPPGREIEPHPPASST